MGVQAVLVVVLLMFAATLTAAEGKNVQALLYIY